MKFCAGQSRFLTGSWATVYNKLISKGAFKRKRSDCGPKQDWSLSIFYTSPGAGAETEAEAEAEAETEAEAEAEAEVEAEAAGPEPKRRRGSRSRRQNCQQIC